MRPGSMERIEHYRRQAERGEDIGYETDVEIERIPLTPQLGRNTTTMTQQPTDTIKWIDKNSELPDEGVTVLLYAPDATEPVWPGYFDEVTAHGYLWRAADGNELEGVTHWAEMPEGPT